MKKTKKLLCLMLALVIVAGIAVPLAADASAAPLGLVRQDSAKWKSYYYGSGNLYSTGCGIFSLVNAVGYLTGKRMDVPSVASWAHGIKAYNVTGAEGTYRAVLYPKVQAKYGAAYGFKVDCGAGSGYWAGSGSTVLKNHLKNGGVAVGHVPGHFIALVGYSAGSNKFHVYDSYPTYARGTTANGGDVWVTQSQLATGKLNLDWFCLLTATGTPASAGGSGSAPEVSYKVGVYKTTTDLNMRSNNNASASIVATLPKGTSVSVTDVKSGWGYINYNGRYGWVNLKYATRTGDLAPAYTLGVYTTTTDLNVRSNNNASSAIVATLPKGTSVSVTDVKDGWGYTKYLGTYGWVNLKYTSRTGGLSLAPATLLGPDRLEEGKSHTISWKPMPGAASYTYYVLALSGKPEPGNNSESGVMLASGSGTLATSVTIPAAKLAGVRYVKVAVNTVYPHGGSWSNTYLECSALPFADVPVSSDYYEALVHGYRKGYFNGTAASKFSPETAANRANVAQVIYTMAGAPAVTGSMPFTDVPGDAYYRSGVAWCYNNGITNGLTATTFGPMNNVTNQQMAVFLYMLAKRLGLDINKSAVLTAYSDYASVASYAKQAMAWAVAYGIIVPKSGALCPNATLTRGELAKAVYTFDMRLRP